MPKFAANLVCTIDSPPRKNAVVESDNDGVIISVSQGSATFRETAGVAFYSGILIPGLSDLMSGAGNPLWQFSRGIRIAATSVLPEGADTADSLRSPGKPFVKKTDGSPLALTTRGLSRSVSDGSHTGGLPDLPRKGNNGNQLAADRYKWTGMYGEVVDYVVFDGMDHFDRFFTAGGHSGLYYTLTGSDDLPVLATGGRIDMMGLLIELQEGPAQINFHALLEIASLNGALAMGYEKTAGSLSKGKQPGLCIIEGADIANMRLLPGSRLRRIL